MDLFDKCTSYTDAKIALKNNCYPYFRAIESSTGTQVFCDGRERIMIGSNNYLGLTQHPRVMQASISAIEKYGTGCTGSRFLNGNMDIHEELEERLAKYLNRDAALVYASGFLANLGTISCLAGRKDVIFSDRENHASIVEAQNIAPAQVVRYRHNDMEELERLLKVHEDAPGKLIVFDGVFSMTGDIVPLPRIVELAEKYGARLYCDCAHALGVIGKEGRGTAHHFGLNDKVDITMGTFSKSFASLGGFVAASDDVIHFIKHKSRSFMFSAALSPASVATALESLKVVQEEPEHLASLWKNTRYMKSNLDNMGYNTLDSETPVIPLMIGDEIKTHQFASALYEMGVFATVVVFPAVPAGQAMIRTSYMANHTQKELDYVLDMCQKLGKKFNILTPQ